MKCENRICSMWKCETEEFSKQRVTKMLNKDIPYEKKYTLPISMYLFLQKRISELRLWISAEQYTLFFCINVQPKVARFNKNWSSKLLFLLKCSEISNWSISLFVKWQLWHYRNTYIKYNIYNAINWWFINPCEKLDI